jgi:hypothetical protein
MPNKKTLLLCWDFPPNDGIGGRRWAKMAKWLLKSGHEIHVIKSKSKVRYQNSAWLSDVESDDIHIYEVNTYLPVKWLNSKDNKFSDKLKHKFAAIYLTFFSNGTIYDKAIGKERDVVKLASKIIELNKIENLIVTGAPFNLIYYAAKIKLVFPKLFVLADYRDPWLNAVNYGMQNLSAKNKLAEQNKQNLVFETIDVITAPNSFLLDEIKSTYTGSNLTKANFVELPHAYDEDDFLNSDKLKKGTPHALKIVYAGSVYLGAKSYFEEFINQINKYNCKNEHLVELEIYMDDYKSLHQFQNAAISIKPSVGKDIFKVISEADYVLILLAEHNKDFKTTKFYEFLPFQKPYLYIGSLGEVAKNISEDEMGFVIKDVKNETVSFIESHFSSNLVFKGLSKFKNHTFQKRVELINNLIETIDA